MKIDLRSSVPIYQQIAEGIRAEIAVGVYRPGEGLPSIRNLAVRLKVNQNTVHKSYGELEAEGLITPASRPMSKSETASALPWAHDPKR